MFIARSNRFLRDAGKAVVSWWEPEMDIRLRLNNVFHRLPKVPPPSPHSFLW